MFKPSYYSLFERLLEDLSLYTFNEELVESADSIELLQDDLDFTVVDGEEGDYGVIRYYRQVSSTIRLVCVRTINGDDDNCDFTDYGIELYREFVMRIFNEKLESLKQIKGC